MRKKIWRKTLAVSMAGALALSVIVPVPFSNPVLAAAAEAAPAQVTADWYKTYQTMDGVGAAYAYTDSIHMLQLATAGHQDTVRHLLDLTFSEKEGTGHDIVRVIIGDNGGLTTTGATAASPGFNPLTGLLADVSKPGFDVEGNAIPMRGSAGQYGYKIEAENRYYDGNTDSIWPVEPEHAPGTLVPVQDFVWDYPSWNQPAGNDDGGPTNLLSAPGEAPVVIKNSPRTRKELFDVDQVWTMRQAMQYGVKQFYACTWTVPYWMSQSSTNNPSKIIRNDTATIDGKPVKIYYQAYADYLVNYIRGMWEQWGIPITHINPFNEVDLAGGTASYVTELINGYIGPTLKKSMQPGGALYDIKNPDGKLIDFIPQLAAVDGTNLGASLSRGGEVFSQTDPDNALDKNPYLDVFTTHLYGTVGIGTDENKLYHTGDFSQSPLDYSRDGSKYPEYLTKYKLWQAEFMNQDTSDGSAGAYTQRYGNQNINDAVRWSNLMTNMFNSNPGFNGFVWWSMWDSNGADGSDLIRFVTTNSQQEPGRISTLTGEYRLFKRFYGYGHFSRFMNPGDVRFDVTRNPAADINVVGFKNPNTNDYSITVSNAKNDDSIQPLEFSLKDFPSGTNSITVFRTSGSENMKKLATIPVTSGKFVIDIPSASIVTIVPSQGTFATYSGLDGERDIFSTLEAEGNDNGIPGDSAGNAGRANEAVTLAEGRYLAYKNLNFADGSANGGVVRRHLLYLTAQTKSAQGGKLAAYVLPVGTTISSGADILSKGTRVAEITVPANEIFGKYQDMVDTGDLSAYGHKDLYIVAEPNGAEGTITVDRFLFGANDSDWSIAANNSTVSIPGNLLQNGDFDTANSSTTDHWSTGRYNNGAFEPSVTGPVLTADTIQSYSGLSRYLKNNATSKVAGSGKIAGRIDAAGQYDGMWQDVTGKLSKGESYNFKGYFLSMTSRAESYDLAAENPGDVEAALVYYDQNGNQLGITPINGRDMPEPYAAREAGDPAYWSTGKFTGRILEGGPLTLSSFQPVDVKVADWHETPNRPFTYDEPAGTVKVLLAVYAKDANILYADQLSLTPELVASYSIFIDGIQPSNFDAAKYEYTYNVSGNAIPEVTAVSSDPAELISISQADSAQGTAIVRFIKGEKVKTYKISFSTNELISFAGGLPAGWEIINPADPQNALSYNADGATIKTLKGDTEYPASHNMLQFPGSAEGNWTLTAKLIVDKPLNDSSMGENSQVGLGISRVSSGEFYRINARKVNTNIKVNNSGKTGSTSFTNNTNQTNLSGVNYFLRIVKEGNVVQGYFSTNSGSSWTAMGSPSTYTPEFFKEAKVQLYGTNTSASTDFQVTFSNVNLIKTSGGTGEVSPDQLAVEEAAALIGTRITVPDTAGDDAAALLAKAQEYLNNHKELKALGVNAALASQNGEFSLTLSKGNASVLISPLTIAAGMKAVRDFEDQTVQGFKPKGGAGVTLMPVKDANHTPGGAYALKVTGRTANSDGPSVNVKDMLKTGNAYKASVWVKLIEPASAQLKLTALVNSPVPYYISLSTQTVSTTGDWVKLEGTYRYLHDDVTLYVESINSATASYYIDDFSFEAAVPPSWEEGSKLEASDLTSTGVTLSWPAAADEAGVTGYRIYTGADSDPVTVSGDELTVSGAVYRYQLTGLLPNTLYIFKVEAGDADGNWSTDGPSVTVTTLPTSDTTPPVWQGGSTLEASGVTDTELTLTWSATATDESGISAYRITNGVDDKPVTVTDAVYTETVTGAVYHYQVKGLKPDTKYTFTVEAGDTGGNWSTGGPSVAAVTLPAADTAPPSWPAGSKLEATGVTTSGLTLTWDSAADDKAVTGYKIYRGAEEIAALSGTARRYEVSGLSAGTGYVFMVQAGDAAGNWSKDGLGLTVTTLSNSGGPSGPAPTPVPTSTPTPTPSTAPGTATPPPAATPAPVPSSGFKDIDGKYSWASEAIDALYAKGVIKGTSETAFSPGKNITRADFVVLLVRALGLEAEAGSNFADVTQGTYYYEALGIARKLGIINGMDGNNFNPKGEVSRQDMMVIAARALRAVNKLSASGSAGDLSSFTDGAKVAKYAVDSVAALIKEEIVQGDGKAINPSGTATRAEAAVIIYRIQGL
ncbi:S-layer homology domain-containing protein [Paenibacillus typhae]|uniref:O-Glycosyl hydrolase n=1 Tax=Paenibacillus typhae TaxID=1174501 RepID=A0A1G8FQ14_9BACL|nr:S-layer homology domain-containing protein [Paenibacillus typhae]SDH84258.1 O-Glycosyl hydrolase [Paenibacillus typhae]